MKEQELIAHLARSVHRQTPRSEWLVAARKQILESIAASQQLSSLAHAAKPSQSFFGMYADFAKNAYAQLAQHRLLMGGATAMLLVLMGGVSFAASRNALPSSSLYPLKLAAESVEGSLVFSDQSKADYTLGLAENRFQELSQLSRSGGAYGAHPRQDLIAKTAQRYAVALSSSTKTLERLKADGNTALAKRTAQKLEKTTDAYSTLLSLLDTASSSSPIAILEDTKALSEEAHRAAQEVLAADTALQDPLSEIKGAATSPEPEPATSSLSTALPSVAPKPVPSIMPNIVQ